MLFALRECFFVVSNFVTCLLGFTVWNAVLMWPWSDVTAEATQDVIFTGVLYVPLAFVILYLPLRAGTILFTINRMKFMRAIAARTTGILLGVAIGALSTHTEWLEILKPIVLLIPL